MRVAIVLLAVGVAGSLGWLAMALADADVMGAYLAAWLFWLAVPMGALPLVMAGEALGAAGALMLVLRRLLLLLPAGAILAIPVLFRTGVLFRRPGMDNPLPPGWMAPGFFIGRAVAVLLVLSLLALVFSRPSWRGPRRGLAVVGIGLHLVLASLAGVDWVMALQPGLASSAFGLLVVVAQLGTACSLAVFLAAIASPAGAILPVRFGAMLAVVLAGSVLLHFTQFLVVWSANLPAEIVWYQVRQGGWGIPAIWTATAMAGLALAVLPTGLGRIPTVVASLAATVLAMHLLEAWWLVLPSLHGRFAPGLADLLAVAGLGGLMMGLLVVLLPRRLGAGHHA